MKRKIPTALLSLTLGALPLLAELKYFPKDKDELIALVADESIKLDEIDTSKIKDMSYLFCATTNDTNDAYLQECKLAIRKKYKGIEKWDTSRVENMSHMFWFNENFNEPLDKWDVSNVKNMDRMFCRATSFNQPLDKWDVSNVEDMTEIFNGAKSFNQDLSMWKVLKLKEYGSWWREMFEGSPLEKDKAKRFVNPRNQ